MCPSAGMTPEPTGMMSRCGSFRSCGRGWRPAMGWLSEAERDYLSVLAGGKFGVPFPRAPVLT
jgi:hypothetical protein